MLSASWDETACVWKLDGTTNPLITLSGHQSAVWSAIQLLSGDIITGSADKTIKVWNKDGLIQHTLTGVMWIVFLLIKLKLNSVALVRERTIPTERPPLVGEVSANFCG